MALVALFITACAIVLLATIPTCILLSYIKNKPLGMQSLADITMRDLFLLELVYIYGFLAIFSVVLGVDRTGIPLNQDLALALFVIFRTATLALLCQAGIHMITLYLLVHHSHILDNMEEQTVALFAR